MATPSHRLKLDRADEHLTEIENLVKPLRERREYPVIETMQPKRKGPEWEYRLDLSHIQSRERLPILVGDYMFNVRSALDHLFVGIVPRKYRRKASFPIFTSDPLATAETSGDYLDAEAASRWNAIETWLPDDCLAAVKVLQPYEASALHGHPANRHALALLSAFQNADKHRELVDAIVGLSKCELHIDGETIYAVPVFQEGTIVAVEDRKMDVKIKGVPVVGLSRGDETWSLDLLTEKVGDFIVNELLPRLEPFLN
jgi:hypothetical protein